MDSAYSNKVGLDNGVAIETRAHLVDDKYPLEEYYIYSYIFKKKVPLVNIPVEITETSSAMFNEQSPLGRSNSIIAYTNTGTKKYYAFF